MSNIDKFRQSIVDDIQREVVKCVNQLQNKNDIIECKNKIEHETFKRYLLNYNSNLKVNYVWHEYIGCHGCQPDYTADKLRDSGFLFN